MAATLLSKPMISLAQDATDKEFGLVGYRLASTLFGERDRIAGHL